MKETYIKEIPSEDGGEPQKEEYTKTVAKTIAIFDDIIGNKFWKDRPSLLGEDT